MVICEPTDTHAPHVSGSTREYCGICATEVWLSPATAELAGEDPGFLCVDCVPGVMRTNDTKLMRPSATQFAEIAELIRSRNDA